MASFGIYQYGNLLAVGSKEQCDAVAHRWSSQHGNIDLEVIELDKVLHVIKTPLTNYRQHAIDWWRALCSIERQDISDSYMDRNSQPRRHWQSLTGREIERIFECQKLAQKSENQ